MKDTEEDSQGGGAATAPGKSSDRLKYLIDSSPSIIYACLPSGDFPATFMSAKVTALLGYEPGEFFENPSLWTECIHRDDKERIFGNLSSLFDKGHHVHEYRFRHKSGSYRWMRDELQLVHDAEGNPLEIIGSWTDITERRAIEEALRHSEDRYRSFVQNFPGIAFRGKLDFTPLFFHGAVEDITGYTEREFTVGKLRWDQVIYPDDLGGYLEEVSQGLRSAPGFSTRREYRIVRKDGEIGWVYEIIRNVNDGSGKPAYVEGTLFDITERKVIEASLEKANKELERQNEELLKLDRMKDGLIRDVSHELKTPVAKHAMQLEILKPIAAAHGLSKAETNAFTVMEDSIRRQEHVVRNLLDLSRLESGGRSYRKEPVHLDEVISKVVGDHQYAIDAYGIEIVSDVQPVTIQSDGEMLWHLLSNLFNNAIKYRNRSVPARITVSVEPRQDEIQIRVADNGIGINEVERQMLFTRFYQASTASEGCGVGLAICKMIAEGLGGRVWIESEGRGKGTTSMVAIPLPT